MSSETTNIKKLVQLDPAVEQLFHEFIWEINPSLSRLKYDSPGIWTRNPVIEKQVDKALREFAAKYRDLLKRYMEESWRQSEEKNDKLFHKYLVGLGIVIGGSFLLKAFSRENPESVVVDLTNILTLPRRKAAQDAFNKSRLDKVISPRVWKLTGQNKTLILNCVNSGILEGKSAAKIAGELKKYLRDPQNLFRRIRDPETGKLKPSGPMGKYHPGQGIYRSSYQNALRLARNEVNMAYRAADQDRWKRNPAVIGYEVKLSGSHPKEDICDEMAGKYPKTFSWLGWHVSCFCYTVPILAPPEQFAEYLKSGKKLPGQIRRIPNKAYWYVQNKTDRILAMKSKPYWLQDNFKVIDGKQIKPSFKTS